MKDRLDCQIYFRRELQAFTSESFGWYFHLPDMLFHQILSYVGLSEMLGLVMEKCDRTVLRSLTTELNVMIKNGRRE